MSASQAKPESLLRSSEVAGRLGVSVRTVRRWCTEGMTAPDGRVYRLAAYKTRMGPKQGLLLIHPDALEDFLIHMEYGVLHPAAAPAAPESPTRRQKRFAADKEAALKACRGET